jgi:hypothetical protein
VPVPDTEITQSHPIMQRPESSIIDSPEQLSEKEEDLGAERQDVDSGEETANFEVSTFLCTEPSAEADLADSSSSLSLYLSPRMTQKTR